MVVFPYTWWNISSASDGVFPDQTKYFRFIHCSMFIIRSLAFIVEQPKKEEL